MRTGGGAGEAEPAGITGATGGVPPDHEVEALPLDELPDAVLVLDDRHRIVRANAAAARLLRSDALAGTPLADLDPRDDDGRPVWAD
ncbi:MAG TPA: PAS domain-containing protein, partial [Acidimicrobiales bacterium]|nr:PAS domain-containing protein [Acidimicrobiales bacterium]